MSSFTAEDLSLLASKFGGIELNDGQKRHYLAQLKATTKSAEAQAEKAKPVVQGTIPCLRLSHRKCPGIGYCTQAHDSKYPRLEGVFECLDTDYLIFNEQKALQMFDILLQITGEQGRLYLPQFLNGQDPYLVREKMAGRVGTQYDEQMTGGMVRPVEDTRSRARTQTPAPKNAPKAKRDNSGSRK